MTGWLHISTSVAENLGLSCSCGENISNALATFFSQELRRVLDPSEELGCPVAFLQTQTLDTSMSGWMCPSGLELNGGDGKCGDTSPVCTAGNVSVCLVLGFSIHH